MSEHDSHDDSALSALYRRMACEEPPSHMDERVLAAARGHVARRSHRWWLPLSTAAMVVLAVSLLLRHQQSSNELQQQIAQHEARPIASVPAPAATPTAPLKERAAAKPEQKAKSTAAETPRIDVQLAESAKSAAPSAEVAAEQASGLASSPIADSAETKQADAPAAGAALRAMAEPEPRREAAPEAPELWLKRIEALRVKGEREAARRELAAFRKAYPAWPLPKELQPLLPEAK